MTSLQNTPYSKLEHSFQHSFLTRSRWCPCLTTGVVFSYVHQSQSRWRKLPKGQQKTQRMGVDPFYFNIKEQTLKRLKLKLVNSSFWVMFQRKMPSGCSNRKTAHFTRFNLGGDFKRSSLSRKNHPLNNHHGSSRLKVSQLLRAITWKRCRLCDRQGWWDGELQPLAWKTSEMPPSYNWKLCGKRHGLLYPFCAIIHGGSGKSRTTKWKGN